MKKVQKKWIAGGLAALSMGTAGAMLTSEKFQNASIDTAHQVSDSIKQSSKNDLDSRKALIDIELKRVREEQERVFRDDDVHEYGASLNAKKRQGEELSPFEEEFLKEYDKVKKDYDNKCNLRFLYKPLDKLYAKLESEIKYREKLKNRFIKPEVAKMYPEADKYAAKIASLADQAIQRKKLSRVVVKKLATEIKENSKNASDMLKALNDVAEAAGFRAKPHGGYTLDPEIGKVQVEPFHLDVSRLASELKLKHQKSADSKNEYILDHTGLTVLLFQRDKGSKISSTYSPHTAKDLWKIAVRSKHAGFKQLVRSVFAAKAVEEALINQGVNVKHSPVPMSIPGMNGSRTVPKIKGSIYI